MDKFTYNLYCTNILTRLLQRNQSRLQNFAVETLVDLTIKFEALQHLWALALYAKMENPKDCGVISINVTKTKIKKWPQLGTADMICQLFFFFKSNFSFIHDHFWIVRDLFQNILKKICILIVFIGFGSSRNILQEIYQLFKSNW